MAYVYDEITIDGTDHAVYLLLADAEAYLAASLHATAWDSATTAQRNKAIVTATRMLDRQRWAGEKTDAANTLSWPRSGVTDDYGEDVDEDTIPQAVVDACAELAAHLLADASAQSNATAGSNVKKLDARGVSVEFFGPRSAGRFPTIVQELIGAFLASADSAALAALAPRTSGTSAESAFDPCDSDDVYDLSE